MDLELAIKERRSIRKFRTDPVPKAVIEDILRLSMWAPSGMNQQNWYFIAVTKEKLSKLLLISKRAFHEHIERSLSEIFRDQPQIVLTTERFFSTFGNAPVVLLAYRIPTVEGDLTDIQSVAAAIQNLLLAAHARGIGGCWMTGPTHLEAEINKLVAVKDMRLQAVIPMGYPDERPPAPKRKPERIGWMGFD